MFTTTLHIMHKNIGRSLCGVKYPNDEVNRTRYLIPESQITRNTYFTDPDDEFVEQLGNNSMYEFCDECMKNRDNYDPRVPRLVHFSRKLGRNRISLCGVRKRFLPQHHKTLNYDINMKQSDNSYSSFCTLCNKIRSNMIRNMIREDFTTKE